jgi:hypothetical protein
MIIKHNTPIAFDTENAKSGRKRFARGLVSDEERNSALNGTSPEIAVSRPNRKGGLNYYLSLTLSTRHRGSHL